MGSIDLRVLGDVQSCRNTAEQLTSLAEGAIQGGTAFHTARSESETLWTGQAGDAFRERLQPLAAGVDDIADHSRTAGQALHQFADDLTTVNARMGQARSIATAAGLRVSGDAILEPEAPTPQGPNANGTKPAETPEYTAAIRNYQAQQAAYRSAAQTAQEARKIEQNAHGALGEKMSAFEAILKDANDQKYFLIASNTTGPLGTAIEQADKWGKIAQTRGNQLDMLKRLIGETDDPYREAVAARAAGVFEQTAAQAAHAEEANAKLSLGLKGTRLGDVLAYNANNLLKLDGALGSVAEKIPVVGGVIAVGQTIYDSRNAKSPGDVVKNAGADVGGFLAGTAATEGALAAAAAVGVAGGPVTLAAVGIGIGVSFGVGEVVNHWGGITHGVEDAAETVGDGVGDAAKSVGHFFGSIF
jgi:uncharacterized protein YukE